MSLPPLLYDRSVEEQRFFAYVIPACYGAVNAIALGTSETAWIMLQLVAILGGFLAGLEHDDRVEAMVRGAFGGALFGAGIVAVHAIADAHPEATVPEPIGILVALTTVGGALLAVLGALLRKRLVRRA